MDKLITKDLNLYRINLMTGNLIYFKHGQKVQDKDYLEVNIKDIIFKIDEVVEENNKLAEINATLSTDINVLKNEINNLHLQLDTLKNTSQKQAPAPLEQPKPEHPIA